MRTRSIKGKVLSTFFRVSAPRESTFEFSSPRGVRGVVDVPVFVFLGGELRDDVDTKSELFSKSVGEEE